MGDLLLCFFKPAHAVTLYVSVKHTMHSLENYHRQFRGNRLPHGSRVRIQGLLWSEFTLNFVCHVTVTADLHIKLGICIRILNFVYRGWVLFAVAFKKPLPPVMGESSGASSNAEG